MKSLIIMEFINFLIILAGFITLFLYQRSKIKILEDRSKEQKQVLQDFKIYSDIIKPEMLKYRSEQYEKLIEKEKNIEVKGIQEEMEKKFRKFRDSSRMLFKAVQTLLLAFWSAMVELPHDRRKSIINEMSDDFKEIFQAQLPQYEEHDRKMSEIFIRMAIEQLGSGGTENQKQNEK